MSGGKYSNDKPGRGAFGSGHLPPPYKGGRSVFAPPPVWTPPPGTLGKPGKTSGKPGKTSGKPGTDPPIRSIVFLYNGKGGAGSGTIVAGGRFVLTNAHVVTDGSTICQMGVWYTNSEEQIMPEGPPDAHGEVVSLDKKLDLAVIKLIDPATGGATIADSELHPSLPLHTHKPKLRDALITLGFPKAGGASITLSEGVYSGKLLDRQNEYYKTDATINPGSSGGGAFDERWRLIGVTTAGTTEGVTSYGLIRPAKFAVPLIEEAKKRG
jgi:S1-C subfamily serine protease